MKRSRAKFAEDIDIDIDSGSNKPRQSILTKSVVISMDITQCESEVGEIQESRENGYIRNAAQEEQRTVLLKHYEGLIVQGKVIYLLIM